MVGLGLLGTTTFRYYEPLFVRIGGRLAVESPFEATELVVALSGARKRVKTVHCATNTLYWAKFPVTCLKLTSKAHWFIFSF